MKPNPPFHLAALALCSMASLHLSCASLAEQSSSKRTLSDAGPGLLSPKVQKLLAQAVESLAEELKTIEVVTATERAGNENGKVLHTREYVQFPYEALGENSQGRDPIREIYAALGGIASGTERTKTGLASELEDALSTVDELPAVFGTHDDKYYSSFRIVFDDNDKPVLRVAATEKATGKPGGSIVFKFPVQWNLPEPDKKKRNTDETDGVHTTTRTETYKIKRKPLSVSLGTPLIFAEAYAPDMQVVNQQDVQLQDNAAMQTDLLTLLPLEKTPFQVIPILGTSAMTTLVQDTGDRTQDTILEHDLADHLCNPQVQYEVMLTLARSGWPTESGEIRNRLSETSQTGKWTVEGGKAFLRTVVDNAGQQNSEQVTKLQFSNLSSAPNKPFEHDVTDITWISQDDLRGVIALVDVENEHGVFYCLHYDPRA